MPTIRPSRPTNRPVRSQTLFFTLASKFSFCVCNNRCISARFAGSIFIGFAVILKVNYRQDGDGYCRNVSRDYLYALCSFMF